MAYLDTSVLVAYYWPESLSAPAQSEIRNANVRAVSPLSEVEFRSALALKVRIGELNREAARGILSAFRLHRADGVYRVVPIEAREYAVACEWIEAFSSSLRALDALHLAAAFANGLTLITADKTLADSAKRFGVKHKLIS